MRAVPIPITWREDLSIFASEGYLRAVSDEFGWLGGYDRNDVLRCILPYTVIRKSVLRMVRLRVETIPVDGPVSIADEKCFLNAAMNYFRTIGADLTIPGSNNAIFRTSPNGAIAVPYGTWVVDLRQSEDELFARIGASHRRQIRKAEKDRVCVRNAIDLADDVHRIVRDTFRQSAMGFLDRMLFRKLIDSLGVNLRILVAERDGIVQSCAVIPFSRHSAYYAYGGSIPGASAGSMHLLHWEAMRMFRSLGAASYDFMGVRIDPEMGSKQEGLATFKRRFGGCLVQGLMWKMGIKPRKYALYNAVVRLLRGGDIVDQETKRVSQFAPLARSLSG